MKNAFAKGLAAALIHLAIILSLGGKLLYDRMYCSRVWVQTGWVDPDLPMRGTYVALQFRVRAPWFRPTETHAHEDVRLSVENNQLVASKSEVPTELSISNWQRGLDSDSCLLDQSVAFFIPEHAQIQFPPRPGEQLWVEVTVPRNGPPRPIQLAVKRGTEWRPLNLR